MLTTAQPVTAYRLFIAIRVPEAVKDSLQKAQQPLRTAMRDSTIRWTPRDQFHLTLKFLGDVEPDRAESLAEALKLACRGFAPLDLVAEGVGFFPERGFPRVVWAGLRDAEDRLPSVQKAVETAVREFTAEEPERRFSGHVTLGRIKTIKRPQADALASSAAEMKTRVFGKWTAGEVELIRSELLPSGARYSSLAVAPLSGSE
jgi:RNA 2',3'-cyclic 3'-phosphodiesterase